MRVPDLLALPTPRARVAALFQRLIPLAQDARWDVLPRAAKDLHLVTLWVGEVNNGGHRQFFDNSAGDRALETLEALERVRAPAACMEALRGALDLFDGGRPPARRWERQDALAARWPGDSLQPRTDALDQALHAVEEPLFEAAAAYLAREADALAAFVDRHPSGLKALDLADDLRLAAVVERGPEARCGETHAALAARRAEGQALSPAEATFVTAYEALAGLLGGRSFAEETGEATAAALAAIERTQPEEVVLVARRLLVNDDAALRAALAARVGLILEALAAFADRSGLPAPPPDPFLVVSAAAFRLRRPGLDRPAAGPAATFLDAFDVLDLVSGDRHTGWFFSSAADRQAEALTALAAVGAGDVAALLREASAQLPGGAPAADAAGRRAQLAALDEAATAALAALDARFQAGRTAALTALAAWTLRHRAAIDSA